MKKVDKTPEYLEEVKERKRIASLKWKKNNPTKVRSAILKRKYGMTIDEYNTMFNIQDGRCWICGKHQSEIDKPLFVDHNHSASAVRALLCHNCNAIIGLAHEDIYILESCKTYINTFKEK